MTFFPPLNRSSSLDWTPESKKHSVAILADVWVMASAPEKQLSQEKFGSIFGVTSSTVQVWLKGSIPETPKLKKMACILSWSLDELVCYLETGDRPLEKSELQRLLYKTNSLPLGDLALLIEVAAKRLVSELKAAGYS